MNTGKYIIHIFIRMVLLLLAVCILAFVLVVKSPIDPLVSYIGTNSTLSQEAKDEISEYWGLNDPLPERFMTWANNILHGDFGNSISFKRPVIDVIKERVSFSIVLMAIAWVLSGVLGFFLGVVAGLHKGGGFDKIVKTFCLLLQSAPTFWLGLLILSLFAVTLGWFPIGMAAPMESWLLK